MGKKRVEELDISKAVGEGFMEEWTTDKNETEM